MVVVNGSVRSTILSIEKLSGKYKYRLYFRRVTTSYPSITVRPPTGADMIDIEATLVGLTYKTARLSLPNHRARR
ncbi:hypothetical protein AUG19_03505 [archaeon 13_1_20CM_2_54_9]|nr:MAG: hypothetical protein AUG19_03505 [archaeon 13_1_20CM_2_54_9]